MKHDCNYTNVIMFGNYVKAKLINKSNKNIKWIKKIWLVWETVWVEPENKIQKNAVKITIKRNVIDIVEKAFSC